MLKRQEPERKYEELEKEEEKPGGKFPSSWRGRGQRSEDPELWDLPSAYKLKPDDLPACTYSTHV
jgi:hypothetical protein